MDALSRMARSVVLIFLKHLVSLLTIIQRNPFWPSELLSLLCIISYLPSKNLEFESQFQSQKQICLVQELVMPVLMLNFWQIWSIFTCANVDWAFDGWWPMVGGNQFIEYN